MPTDIPAVGARHHQIENDKRKRGSIDRGNRGVAIRNDLRLETLATQIGVDQGRRVRVVLDNQDSMVVPKAHGLAPAGLFVDS